MSDKLVAVRNKLDEYDENSDKSQAVFEIMLSYFEDIENLTLDELHARNINSGLIGLDIMVRLKPLNEEYENAAALLRNPEELINIMLQRGLDSESDYYKEYADILRSIR